MIEEWTSRLGVCCSVACERVEENTIVIFTSDNGGERFADTMAFTGKRLNCWKAVCAFRLDLLARAHPAGRTTNQVSISMDLGCQRLLALRVLARPDPAYLSMA